MTRQSPLLWFLIIMVGLPLIFYGCKKKANPFEADSDLGNNPPADNLVTVTITPTADSIAVDTLFIITFSDFMNKGSVETAGNITVLNVANNNSVAINVEYEVETRKAYVSPADSFPDDTGLLLTITRNVINRSGISIDGDVDGVDDGMPYDERKAKFYTGGGVALFDRTRISPPTIDDVDPDTEGDVPLNTTFTVEFDEGVNPMDVTTLIAQNFSLFETFNPGNTVPLEVVNTGDDFIELRRLGGTDLTVATQYTFRLLGGTIKAMPDTTGNTTSYLLNLDTDDDGPEANEPDFEFDFITEENSADGTPPWVSGPPPDPVFGPDFSVTFSEAMDIATFTSNNIRVFRTVGMVPLTGSIIPFTDKTGFRFTLENALPGTNYTLFISSQVRDDSPAKWQLDEPPPSGNGVGGEETDDFTDTFDYF